MVSWTHPEKAVSRLNSDALVTQLPSSSLNKKYRIIPEDIKLSKVLDVELLAEWDRYRKWMLRAAGRGE